jgi:hypothetical protein
MGLSDVSPEHEMNKQGIGFFVQLPDLCQPLKNVNRFRYTDLSITVDILNNTQADGVFTAIFRFPGPRIHPAKHVEDGGETSLVQVLRGTTAAPTTSSVD